MDRITHEHRIYRDIAYQIPIAIFLVSFNFPKCSGIQGETVLTWMCHSTGVGVGRARVVTTVERH